MTFSEWCLLHARTSGKLHGRVTLDDKLAFFRQLSTIISSGTPLLQAWQLCTEQCLSRRLRDVLREISERIASGSSLHDAAAYHPQHFEHHWIEVIRTGEVTGKLDFVLGELVKLIDETRSVRRKVASAMTYPILLSGVAVVALAMMLWFVVPTFSRMFAETGANLPYLTQIVVNASDFLVRYGVYLLLGLAAAAFGVRRFARTDEGRRLFATAGVATPLIGELMVNSAMYRFSATLSLLLKSGVPLLESLGVLRGVFERNPLYRDAIAETEACVAAGRTLSDSLGESVLFTNMVVSMVRIGEESALLAGVMHQVAPFYREKTEALMARVTKLMEPAIIIGMGVALSVVMLAIYLPMFEMAGTVK